MRTDEGELAAQQGDLVLIDGHLEVVVSRTVVTGYPEETAQQEAARRKTGGPVPTYSYVAVKSRPATPFDLGSKTENGEGGR